MQKYNVAKWIPGAAPLILGLGAIACMTRSAAASPVGSAVTGEDAQVDEPAPNGVESLADSTTSPSALTWEALLNWLLVHGTRVVAIAGLAVILLWVVNKVRQKLVTILSRRSGTGTVDEREKRLRTLMSVFQNFANVAIVTAATLTILSELGINIAPLLAGVGVVGLAVAFGAQNLLRDFFTGFMILLENQYSINDVVRLGDTAGLVENITLRHTRLRSLDGSVHFIPNGSITTVTNMTHEYSRAVFDIGVAYKESVDQVMAVLMELANGMRTDPTFGPLILEDPEMLGVDAFADSAVIIRFRIKTYPLQQWKIKRELLRRIKNRFDRDGIEIPFPHRTVFHRFEDGVPEDLADRFANNA